MFFLFIASFSTRIFFTFHFSASKHWISPILLLEIKISFQRDAEAVRAEAQEAKESLLSCQAEVKRRERIILNMKEERSKLRGDLKSVQKENENLSERLSSWRHELDQRQQTFKQLAVEKAELERHQQLDTTTIKNLSEHCETLQQELRSIQTEKVGYESKVGELNNCLSSEQAKMDAIARQLEKSRDEVNKILGSKSACSLF